MIAIGWQTAGVDADGRTTLTVWAEDRGTRWRVRIAADGEIRVIAPSGDLAMRAWIAPSEDGIGVLAANADPDLGVPPEWDALWDGIVAAMLRRGRVAATMNGATLLDELRAIAQRWYVAYSAAFAAHWSDDDPATRH